MKLLLLLLCARRLSCPSSGCLDRILMFFYLVLYVKSVSCSPRKKIHHLIFFFTNRFEELIQTFSLPSHGVRTLYPTQTMMAHRDTKIGGSKFSLHGQTEYGNYTSIHGFMIFQEWVYFSHTQLIFPGIDSVVCFALHSKCFQLSYYEL